MSASRSVVLLLAVVLLATAHARAPDSRLQTAERTSQVSRPGVQPVSQLRWFADLKTAQRKVTDHSEEGKDCFCFLIWWLCICWY